MLRGLQNRRQTLDVGYVRLNKDRGGGDNAVKGCIRCAVISPISSSHPVNRKEEEDQHATRSYRSLNPEFFVALFLSKDVLSTEPGAYNLRLGFCTPFRTIGMSSKDVFRCRSPGRFELCDRAMKHRRAGSRFPGQHLGTPSSRILTLCP